MQAHQYSDLHRLLWICGIIGSIGGAVGIGIGMIKWMSAIYAKGSKIVGNIMSIEEIHASTAATQQAVDVMQTNHLSHIETDMKDVARTNAQLVSLSTDIRDGIKEGNAKQAVLIDLMSKKLL